MFALLAGMGASDALTTVQVGLPGLSFGKLVVQA